MAEQEIEFSIEDRSRYVRALYTFEANDNTQLTINPGDILEVFYRDDSGWWDGKNVSTQHDGYFPGNYTEPLGDNLDIIKHRLMFGKEEQRELHTQKQTEELFEELSRSTASINIRNAEPLIKRCIVDIKNDCYLCSIHHRALCIYIFIRDNLHVEYDAYVFRSLSCVEHTLCIFGAVSINHLISSFNIIETQWIRFVITIILSVIYIIFLFATSNTALMFLKESPNNKESTNIRDRSIENNIGARWSLLCCFRCMSLKCGKCGFKSCAPYTFIYTQFIMLLYCYILAFLWLHLCINIQLSWYKHIILIVILLIISLFALILLKRKLTSVYHIYRYYKNRDTINGSRLDTSTRPYQVALYLYFWCLLTEITLFIFALPLGSCFASFCYSLLSYAFIDMLMARITAILIYMILSVIICILSWRRIHLSMMSVIQYKHKDTNTLTDDNRFRINSVSSVAMVISGSEEEDDEKEEHEMIEEYESDIPDFMMLILMKYYGHQIESTEFNILSLVIFSVFCCDIFIIGFWFNLWMLFDNVYGNLYLYILCVLTVLLPFICSYLFGKTFQYLCCTRNNYQLSINLERDKLWIKAVESRWFIVYQSLIMGYLWCEYAQRLWFKYIDTKYNSYLFVLCVYIVIFIVIIIFKLNKKLLRLLWAMHHDDNHFDKNCKEELKNGVGNLGLNASVKSNELEKKLVRSMISHNTQKANKAILIQNNENKNKNNHEIEIQKKKNKNDNKINGLSTSLLQSDDDDDAQIL